MIRITNVCLMQRDFAVRAPVPGTRTRLELISVDPREVDDSVRPMVAEDQDLLVVLAVSARLLMEEAHEKGD